MRIKAFLSITCLALPLIFYSNCSKFAATKSIDEVQSNNGQGLTTDLVPCVLSPGISARPSTFADITAIINSLAKPVSLSCFLRVLERPLTIYASESPLSAQPSPDSRSPRVFIFNENLIMSVVLSGRAANYLELSELVDSQRSVKGEIKFPVLVDLPTAAPYQQVVDSTGARSRCTLCHQNEMVHTETTSTLAFVSGTLQPKPSYKVLIADLERDRGRCNEQTESQRCSMLSGIFGQGEVTEGAFPSDMPVVP